MPLSICSLAEDTAESRREKAERIRGGKITLDRFFLKNGGWAFVCLVLMAFVYGLLVNYLSVFAWERGIEANSGYFFLFMSVGLIMSRFFAGGMICLLYTSRCV